MPFEKGRDKTGGIKKGQKHKKTLIREALAERMADFDDNLYDETKKFLKHKDINIRLQAWKELCKYRLPREIKSDITTKGKELPPALNITVKSIGDS